MTLNLAVIGGVYLIEDMKLPQKTEKRLEALGMTHGTKIQVINTKDRGTMIVKVRGTRFAIGRDISANIDVTEVK
ncbi:MAG: FeoA domain-containing protein [Firmicutes bacterium]|nr:FeoA domain-containing protein [Bacillota bacterium]MBQ2271798.1 FeoA domain-containing protein [Bacillota bacterium]MBQ5797007.1 FeoA domain-containing protein [Bacillota bacterium]MBR5001462.1 FeoA domain-containing protein [Bacillota bacterium]MBR6500648.1 FeoA domain-containing protein [Bacillota bacterium]